MDNSKASECPICCDEIVIQRDVMTCPFCEFICCRDCLKDFFLTSSVEFRCMNTVESGVIKPCGLRWSAKHTWKMLGKWLNDPFVKDARRELLLKRELGKKQEYMPYVVREKERKDLEAEHEECLKFMRTNNPGVEHAKEQLILQKRIRDEPDIKEKKKLREKLEQLPDKWGKEWVAKYAHMVSRSKEIEQRFRHLGSEGFADGNVEMARTALLCNCPSQKCRGMISSFDFRCNLCKIQVCEDCWESLGDDRPKHKCDEDILKNVQSLKKDTKPCPTCRVRVHKIDGCNHFFCPHCGASWDWASGNLLDEKWNTNPHLVEWKREKKKLYNSLDLQLEEKNIDCSYEQLRSHINSMIRNYDDRRVMESIVQTIAKIENIRRDFQREEYVVFAVKYYIGEWTKRQYEVALLSHHDSLEKESEVLGVIGTWAEVAKALMVECYEFIKAEELKITLKNLIERRNTIVGKLKEKEKQMVDILLPLALETREFYCSSNIPSSYWSGFSEKYYISAKQYNYFSVQKL